MALPSQSVSQNARGRYMYRRKRRNRIPVALIVICAIIGGIVWWSLDSNTESAPAASTAETVEATSAPAQQETPTSSASDFDAQRRSATLEATVSSPPAPARTRPETATLPTPAAAPAAASTPKTTIATSPSGQSSPFLDTGRGNSGVLLEARQLLSQDRPVEARSMLSGAIASGTLAPAENDEARYMLASINDRLVFSKEIVAGDPYTISYTVQSGDSLAKIVKSLGVQVDWRFIQRINGLARPDQIRPGQVLKIVTGPFHGAIERRDHRLDLYLGEGPNQVFVRDYLVGLGEHNCTPSGLFRVRQHSKLINPPWTNPRSREHFTANDPNNPIGEYWVGLEGMEGHNQQEAGFGLHGTIEPQSIGRNESMGCVRMRDGEIDVLYEVMTEGVSTLWLDEGQAVSQVPGG